jgi:hypothetical protein
MFRANRVLKTLYLLAAAGGFGCGSHNVAKPLPTASLQLRSIANAYFQATNSLDRPPASKDEIMPFLKAPADPNNPEKTGSPADVLRSPDDGEEFVIHWGVDVRDLNVSGNPDRLPVLAYERQGKDGKRYVLQVRNVRYLTDEEFRALPFPPGVRPPP